MKKNLYNLTNPQKSIWLTEQFYENTSINNIAGLFFMHQNVNFDLLRKSINILINNNDSFKLKFKINNNNLEQYIDTVPNLELIVNKFNTIEEVKAYTLNLVDTPSFKEDSLLFEFVLFNLPNNTGGFIVKTHHLISDAWAYSIIGNQIISIYSNLLSNTPIETIQNSYLEYINNENSYLNSDLYQKDKLYWNTIYSTIPDIVALPSSISKENSEFTNSPKAKRLSFTLSEESSKSILQFCKNTGLSAYNFFMSAYNVYISKMCNSNEFSIGTPVLNRKNIKEKNTLGMFISTIPYKVEVLPNISFAEYAKSISKDFFSAFKHQKYPYHQLLNDLRANNTNLQSLFNIFISYQNMKITENIDKIPYECFWISNTNTNSPLSIHIYDTTQTNEFTISYDYQIEKYNEYDINMTHERVMHIINTVLETPNILIKDIGVTTFEEKNIILNNFNNTATPYNKNETIIDLFEKVAELNPNKTAIVSNNSELTYEDLNKKANSLARYLKGQDIKNNDVVGIMMKRSTNLAIGLLSILKCGASYLPIDPEYPIERIEYMLKNSNAKYIIIDNSVEEISSLPIITINIEKNKELFNSYENTNLNTLITPESLIYLIYTSGSTGNPKGVMLTHQNIRNFILGMSNLIDFNPNKVMVSLTTICFDIFALELWCGLANGLKVVIANELEQSNQQAFNELCMKNSINIIQTTPSRYKMLISDNNYLDFLNIATDILVGGEGVPLTLKNFFTSHSKANIYNMYGPTETTVWSTVKDMTNDSSISIGKPIANTTCYILDNNQMLLPPYVIGNLYIGGDGVSKGYKNQEELTNKVFVNSPFNNEIIYNTGDLAYYTKEGNLIHLGRSDFQVKIGGYRIDLEEIETNISKFPNINENIVVGLEKYLVCFYTASTSINVPDLITHLITKLPNYMLPAEFKQLDSFPLTQNGKIDRKTLINTYKKDLDNNKKDIEKASTENEKIITNLIIELFEISEETLDINTPFFSLGIDSLGLIEMQSKLLHLGIILSTQDFYKYPNIKKLAEHISNNDNINKEEEAKLPTICLHTESDIIENSKKSTSTIGDIFLTGANGFIGIHVLHKLLHTTNINIYCLVRGNNEEHSISRLIGEYKFYFNLDISDLINKRIYVLNGSIGQEKFNLNNTQFLNLTNNISTIIHTAATVKHYGDFTQFLKVNAEGTQRIAEYALEHKKTLIHISSISVSGNYLVKQDNRNVNFSENDLYIGQHYEENVYVNSKLSAENIIYSYILKGLNAKVLRIGIVSGRYSDGIFQKNISANAFYSRIKAIVSLGKISEDMLNQEIEFTPVDYTANAIVKLALTELGMNKAYHIYDHNLISVEKIVLALRKNGFNIEILNKTDFQKFLFEISKNKSTSKKLNAIINDIQIDKDNSLDLNYNFTVSISSNYTQKYLNILDFNWPLIDENYLDKIICHMKNVNFI